MGWKYSQPWFFKFQANCWRNESHWTWKISFSFPFRTLWVFWETSEIGFSLRPTTGSSEISFLLLLIETWRVSELLCKWTDWNVWFRIYSSIFAFKYSLETFFKSFSNNGKNIYATFVHFCVVNFVFLSRADAPMIDPVSISYVTFSRFTQFPVCLNKTP